MKKILNKLILLIAICVFIYSSYNLFQIFSDNSDEKKETEQIQEIVSIPDEPTEEELEEFVLDFNKLVAINPDVVGYIVVEDTSISYPIVQGEDNDYYLDHTFYKSENYAGAIFMDYTASSDFSDLNTFIYGHNVYHGTMFAELANYMNESFFRAHPYVYLYTPTANYKLQVFSAYCDKSVTNAYQMHFANTQDYSNYLNLICGKSRYNSGVSVSTNDRIVTLYTCSYENETPTSGDGYIDDRYFIHCKLIKELSNE